MSTNVKYSLRDLENDFGKLSFAKALEAHRLGEEISQKDFAKFLKISPQSLCDLEKGRKIPSPDRAARIAKALKEPIAYWVTLALQDLLNEQKLNLVINVSDRPKKAA